jgi:hypothetical protein
MLSLVVDGDNHDIFTAISNSGVEVCHERSSKGTVNHIMIQKS